MKTRVLVAAVLVAASCSLWGQQITDGTLRVRLHPQSGRFSFYAESLGEQPVSLLFEPDPRTTTLSVLDGNRVLRMGEGGGFSLTTDADLDRLQVQWSSPTLVVTQTVSIANTATGSAAVTISVRNASETTRRISVRYLMDTALGDSDTAHFQTASGREIDSEYHLQPSVTESYWVSMGQRGSFYYTVFGPQTTPAESVVFANWKRLSDSRWGYTPSATRSFSLIPFSINDSAAAVYYETQPLSPGETREIRFLLGTGNRPRYADTPTPSYQAGPLPPSGDAFGELDAINDMLREINRLLASDRVVHDAQVEALRARLQDISADRQPTIPDSGAR
jgi:hypothetical protein